MREICHFNEIESGGVDFMRSAIGHHDNAVVPGEPLPCGRDACAAGPAFAALLRSRLDNDGGAVEGAPSYCAASLVRRRAPERDTLSADACVVIFSEVSNP